MDAHEKDFKKLVDSLNIDDQPPTDHCTQLEKQVLDQYAKSKAAKHTKSVKSESIMNIKPLKYAAAILLIASVLTFVMLTNNDSQPISDNNPASPIGTPRHSITQENPGHAASARAADQLKFAQQLYAKKDLDGLMNMLNTDQLDYLAIASLASSLAELGNHHTLTLLNDQSDNWQSDQQNPFTQPAKKLAQRLKAQELAQPDTTDNTDIIPDNNTETVIVDAENHRDDIFSLKVIDKATKQPIPNALVKIRIIGDNDTTTTTKTNNLGRCDIQLPENPLPYLSVSITVPSYVPMQILYRVDNDKIKVPLNYTLNLEKGTSIGAIVKNAQGDPILNAAVTLLVPSNNKIERPAIREHKVKTDDRGKWHCDIMPSELNSVWIRLAHPDYIDDISYDSKKLPVDTLREMTGIMTMEKGISISGIVMDTDGKPIHNALVAQGSDRWGVHYPSTKTDELGKFIFKNAIPGQMVLTVSAKEMAPDIKTIDVRQDLKPVEFNLEPGFTIRGRLIDVDGNPVSGALVSADTWRSHRSISWRVTTDDQGRFQWNAAPADEVLFYMGKKNYMNIRDMGLIASQDEYEIVLYPPFKVTGAVTDARTGEPVNSFTLIEGTKSDEYNPIYWNRRTEKDMTDGKINKIYNEPENGYVLRFEAEGYLPSVSRVFTADQDHIDINFELEKGDGLQGVVFLPDSSPAHDAQVVISTGNVSIENGKISENSNRQMFKTDSQGSFSYIPEVENYVIVAVHEQGWGRIYSSQLDQGAKILLQPWATVTGTVYLGRDLGADQEVSIDRDLDDSQRPYVMLSGNCKTDQHGRFIFDRVMAGKMRIGRKIKLSKRSSTNTDNERVEVEPGQTVDVIIGGKGRPVAGRLVTPPDLQGHIDWKLGWISMSEIINVEPIEITYPDGFAALHRDQQLDWVRKYYQSDELKEYRQHVEELHHQSRSYPVIIHEDGSFKVDAVVAGHYQLKGHFNAPSNDRFGDSKSVGAVEFEFDVPHIPDGYSDQVLQLGDIEAEVFKDVEIGDQAPDFEYTDIDGNIKKLSDYQGKFVLIDLWHRQAREDAKPGIEEMVRLHITFGTDNRFVILSLTNAEATPPQLMRQYIEHYNMNWEVGLFQYTTFSKALRGYGFQNYPDRFLVGPQGNLLNRNLNYPDLTAEIEELLAQ